MLRVRGCFSGGQCSHKWLTVWSVAGNGRWGGGGGSYVWINITEFESSDGRVGGGWGMAFGDRFLQPGGGGGGGGVTGRKAGFSGVKNKSNKTCKKELVPSKVTRGTRTTKGGWRGRVGGWWCWGGGGGTRHEANYTQCWQRPWVAHSRWRNLCDQRSAQCPQLPM